MTLSPENGTGEGPLLRLIPRIAPPNDGIVLKNVSRGVAESEPAPGTRRNRAGEGESGAGWRVGWGSLAAREYNRDMPLPPAKAAIVASAGHRGKRPKSSAVPAPAPRTALHRPCGSRVRHGDRKQIVARAVRRYRRPGVSETGGAGCLWLVANHDGSHRLRDDQTATGPHFNQPRNRRCRKFKRRAALTASPVTRRIAVRRGPRRSESFRGTWLPLRTHR